MSILEEILIFFSSEPGKQCYVELLYRMTNFQGFCFCPYSNEPNFYIKKNIARRYVLVNLLLMKYTLIFGSVYFQYSDTLKILYHNRRHFNKNEMQ